MSSSPPPPLGPCDRPVFRAHRGVRNRQEKEQFRVTDEVAISWGMMWRLLKSRHKFRILVLGFALVGCTVTLSLCHYIPESFFEVLIGKTPTPLWDVLGKIAVVYALESVFTIIFVVNLERHVGEDDVRLKSSDISKDLDSEGMEKLEVLRWMNLIFLILKIVSLFALKLQPNKS